MKIIRWLISHSFLILLIVVVIYGYMFWGNLLGRDTPAGAAVAYLSSEFVAVEEFVDAVKAKQTKLNGEQTEAQESSTTLETTEVTTAAGVEFIEPDAIVHEPAAATQASINAAVTNTDLEQQMAERQNIEQQPVDNSYRYSQEETPQLTAVVTEPDAIVPDAIVYEPAAVAQDGINAAVSNADLEQQMAEQPNIEQPPADNSYRYSQEETPQLSVVVAEPEVDELLADGREKDMLNKGQVERPEAATPEASVALEESEVKEAFVSAEIEKQLGSVNDQGKVVDDSQRGDAVRASWIMARKSFYQRNYALSEQNYQNVIASTEDNYDAYGELGNIYFNQGKKQQAAAAYFEAAVILVRKGQVDRARSMVGLLNHLDKDKASKLQQLIDKGLS